jgi:F-type H+-transporting ATPase subunit epsilon
MATLRFELVSPERLLISGEVESVTLPGAEGEFQVLAGHAPLLALLGPGIMTVAGGTEPTRRLFIDGGFCDVSPAGCTVLAEAAYPSDEVGRIDEMIAAAETGAAALSGDALDQANRRLATLKAARAGV